MSEFKRGDLVVCSNDSTNRNLFSVRYVAADEIVIYEVLDEMGAKTFTEPYPYFDIRHATQKEIDAGRRLS